ncbi:phenylalanine--tRNA ligase subunit beta [Candidatus Woesearchaeota archaeon]|nr:phenylalanine--tRNA ligase subunit beta [Candidatus Woesearchaeota archaeon]|tara:strand:+ start:14138 stop:15784 length:1647 start_codon:yes stop_codon:yes gene_type:complete
MPTININRKVFERYVGKKLSTEKLKDRISYLGTDLEDVNDEEIVVEIFPDRPDMLSVQGFARAFSSFIGLKTGLRHYKVEHSNEKMIVDKSVANVRPYTACAIVKDMRFDDEKIKEVIDIQEKLHITYGRHRKKIAIGIYPFEKIKTPITFLAQNPKDIIFQPLEFPKKINALQILKQHPAGKEYGHLLEGKEMFPVFRDANGEVLSVPPIINSHRTGKISEKTRDVFIECSGFDLRVLEKCLNIIVCALYEMGGKIYSMDLSYGNKKQVTPDLKPEEMKVDIDYVNKWLGLNLNESEIKKLFERMGYGYRNKKALIPAYRADIIHQVDLAEDIAIAYGYENFEAVIPQVATIAEENKFEIFKSKIAHLLVGLNFLETSTYNLANKEVQCKKMNAEIALISLANSISSDYNVLRAWVIPSLIEILSNNKHHEYPQKIFTIGTIFKQNNKFETNIEENERLAVAVASEKTDYTEIKQVLDYLFRSLDLKYEIKEAEHSSFIEGRVARVNAKGKNVAYIGEINPQVIENWELETPVTAFELNLTELFEVI